MEVAKTFKDFLEGVLVSYDLYKYRTMRFDKPTIVESVARSIELGMQLMSPKLGIQNSYVIPMSTLTHKIINVNPPTQPLLPTLPTTPNKPSPTTYIHSPQRTKHINTLISSTPLPLSLHQPPNNKQ